MHAEYLKSIFDVRLRNRTVAAIAKLLKDKKIKYDAIAVTGVSGITMGSMVAFHLKKRLVIVRKNIGGEATHSWIKVEHTERGKLMRYIVIDDLIDSGDTINRIINSIELECGNDVKCAGVVLYDKGVRFKDKDYISKYITKASSVPVVPVKKGIEVKGEIPVYFDALPVFSFSGTSSSGYKLWGLNPIATPPRVC